MGVVLHTNCRWVRWWSEWKEITGCCANSRYTVAVTVLIIRTNGPTPPDEHIPYTMTLYLLHDWHFFITFWDQPSTFRMSSKLSAIRPNWIKFTPSLKLIYSQSLSLRAAWTLAYAPHAFWFFLMMIGLGAGGRALKPTSVRRRDAVERLTSLLLSALISREITAAVSKGSIMA